MPKINQMMPSKYLKQADFPQPALLTIADIKQITIESDEGATERKWAMYFDDQEKPLLLNSTNINLAAQICNSEDTDYWIGKQVVIYTDPTISFGGKLVGGLRLRAQKQRKQIPPVQAPTKPAPVEEMDDDIPF